MNARTFCLSLVNLEANLLRCSQDHNAPPCPPTGETCEPSHNQIRKKAQGPLARDAARGAPEASRFRGNIPCRQGQSGSHASQSGIPASRESAIQEDSQLDVEAMVFSDGSVIGGGVGAAVLYRNGEEKDC